MDAFYKNLFYEGMKALNVKVNLRGFSLGWRVSEDMIQIRLAIFEKKFKEKDEGRQREISTSLGLGHNPSFRSHHL